MLTQLKHIGLSENEAKVYLAMLELGPSPVLEIASKAGINRPTAYAQIETLKKMGLISMQTKGKKQLYIAEDPDQLEFLIDREKKDLEQKREELNAVLPDLKAMFDLAGEKPVVRYFEGKEGLLKIQEEFLKVKNKTIYALYDVDGVLKLFPKHHDTYTPRRVAKNIHTRVIYTSSRGPFLNKLDNKKLLRELKFIPSHKLPIKIDITIFDDNVAISTLSRKVNSAVITNPDVAQSFRGIIESLWQAYK